MIYRASFFCELVYFDVNSITGYLMISTLVEFMLNIGYEERSFVYRIISVDNNLVIIKLR